MTGSGASLPRPLGAPDRVGSPARPPWAAALLPFLLPALFAAEPPRVELAPGLPALAEMGVPGLDEILPEHRLSGNGLVLAPEAGPYEWTRVGADGGPFRIRLAVDGQAYERGVLTLWDWHNRAVAQRAVAPGTEETLEIAIAGLGAYLLTFDGWRDGKVRGRLIRNLAATEDLRAARGAWKVDEFFLGICAFPGRYHWKPDGVPTLPRGLTEQQAREREAGLVARTGLQVVRVDVSLEMNPRPGTSGAGEDYDFDFSRMDAAVDSYTSRGFQLALQTMNSPDWAVRPQYAGHGKNRWRYPHRERPQRAYLAALVGRYGRHARFVQVSNEPDQVLFWAGTEEEFVEQYRYSLEEIRRSAPDLPVTTGGYALVDEAKCAYFIGQLHSQVDLPVYNAHGNLADYKRSFAALRRLQAAAGDTSDGWINTEAGYSAWRLDQERRQGQVDPQKALYSWAHGHRGLLLFCSRMTRGPGRDGAPDFGLLDHQFSPRFAYASVSALVSALAGASFVETLAESEDVHLYLFERGGDRILAGFTLGEEPATATVATNAREIVAVDEMGNERNIEAAKTLSLALDGYPRYWILRDASSAEPR